MTIAMQEIRRITSSNDRRMVDDIMKTKLGVVVQQTDAEKEKESDPDPDRIISSVEDSDKPEETERIFPITESQLGLIIDEATSKATQEGVGKLKEAESQAEKDRAKWEAERDVLQRQIDTQEALATVLAKHNVSPHAIVGAHSAIGSQHVAIAMSGLRGGVHPLDAAKELQRISDSAKTYQIHTEEVGHLLQSDDRELMSFMRENRDATLQALDAYAKKHGLLTGNNAVVTQAGTSTADITPFLLKTLSAFMRLTTVSQHNWEQFITTSVSVGKNRGDGAEVPRYVYLDCSEDPADYQIGRDDDISSAKQPLSIGSELITLGLNGLGKTGLAGNLNAPVSVAKFFQATSIYDLMGILNKVLYESYMRFLTSSIRTEYGKTTRRYFNNGDVGVTNPSVMAAGAGGQLTVDFLDYIGATMGVEGIPEYQNGMYALQVGEMELLPLRKSLKAIERAMDKSSIEEITSVLQPNTPNGDANKVSGYVGNVGKFMVFCTNTLYKGVNAMTPTTIAASIRDIYNAYAFGADAVGRAQAMPFTMVYDSSTNFSLRDTVSWVSIETIKGIDVDPALSVPTQSVKQQLRVIKLALSRNPI
jgi:hypothetical protein